jgi:hypothetical protein
MILLILIPPALSFLILAAHFFRAETPVFSLISIGMFLALCFARSRWVLRAAQVLLVLGFVEWLRTTNALIRMRLMEDREWKRAAIILLSVGVVALLSALLLQTRRARQHFAARPEEPATPATAPRPQIPA